MVGWGTSGKEGREPKEDAGAGVFRRGENIVEKVTGNALVYSFDSPEEGGLDLEALSWEGDSGGPVFVGGKVAGLNSAGDCCDYGDEDKYAFTGS